MDICANLLRRMSLADAQTLAIRKLLSKSAYDSNVTPGPPLPASHPSPALIAKLHLECASLYSSARSLAKTPGSSKSPEGQEEVSTDLRKYLADEAAFHGALSRKWLGVDAGENGGRAKGGEAVEFLRWAKKYLEDLKDSSKGVSLGKAEKEKKGQKKEKVLDELAKVTVFYKHYKKMNDSVGFLSYLLRYKKLIPFQATLSTCPVTKRPTNTHTNRPPCNCSQTFHASSPLIWTWFCGPHSQTSRANGNCGREHQFTNR